jgi:hypothetical protein
MGLKTRAFGGKKISESKFEKMAVYEMQFF